MATEQTACEKAQQTVINLLKLLLGVLGVSKDAIDSVEVK